MLIAKGKLELYESKPAVSVSPRDINRIGKISPRKEKLESVNGATWIGFFMYVTPPLSILICSCFHMIVLTFQPAFIVKRPCLLSHCVCMCAAFFDLLTCNRIICLKGFAFYRTTETNEFNTMCQTKRLRYQCTKIPLPWAFGISGV